MKKNFYKIDIQFLSESEENTDQCQNTEEVSENGFDMPSSSDSEVNSGEGAFFNFQRGNDNLSDSYEDVSNDKVSDDEALDDESEMNFETGEVIEKPTEKSGAKVFLSSLFDLIEVFSYALAMMVVVFLFVFKFVTVDGHSMLGTLQHEDRLVVCNLFYYPENNDVIVINLEERNELLVKRVIGVEGDEVKIDFDTWEIWVNNEKLPQPYLVNSPEFSEKPMEKGNFTSTDENNCVSFKVEKGKVFVLGDNRNHSSDSRVFGQMDIEEILGRVIFRVFPFENAGSIS